MTRTLSGYDRQLFVSAALREVARSSKDWVFSRSYTVEIAACSVVQRIRGNKECVSLEKRLLSALTSTRVQTRKVVSAAYDR